MGSAISELCLLLVQSDLLFAFEVVVFWSEVEMVLLSEWASVEREQGKATEEASWRKV